MYNIIYQKLLYNFVHIGSHKKFTDYKNKNYFLGIFKNIFIINLTYTLYILRKIFYFMELIGLERLFIYIFCKKNIKLKKFFNQYIQIFLQKKYINNKFKKNLLFQTKWIKSILTNYKEFIKKYFNLKRQNFFKLINKKEKLKINLFLKFLKFFYYKIKKLKYLPKIYKLINKIKLKQNNKQLITKIKKKLKKYIKIYIKFLIS